MKNTTLFKIVGIWGLLAIVAVLNAAVRELVLVPIIGEKLALPFSGVLLSILIFLTTLSMVPLLKISISSGYWLVGMVWVCLTLTFEYLFGHYIIGEPWDKLLTVFNILEGDLFLLALFTTGVSPYVAAKIRGLI